MTIKTYRDARGEWRWSALDQNNKIIADGAESYKTEASVRKALTNVVGEFRSTVVFERKTFAERTS